MILTRYYSRNKVTVFLYSRKMFLKQIVFNFSAFTNSRLNSSRVSELASLFSDNGHEMSLYYFTSLLIRYCEDSLKALC